MKVPRQTFFILVFAAGALGLDDYASSPYFLIDQEAWQAGGAKPSWWLYDSDTERDVCNQYGYGNLGPIRFKFKPPGTFQQRKCYRFNVVFFDDKKVPTKQWLANNLCNVVSPTDDVMAYHDKDTSGSTIEYYTTTTPNGLVNENGRPRLCNGNSPDTEVCNLFPTVASYPDAADENKDTYFFRGCISQNLMNISISATETQIRQPHLMVCKVPECTDAPNWITADNGCSVDEYDPSTGVQCGSFQTYVASTGSNVLAGGERLTINGFPAATDNGMRQSLDVGFFDNNQFSRNSFTHFWMSDLTNAADDHVNLFLKQLYTTYDPTTVIRIWRSPPPPSPPPPLSPPDCSMTLPQIGYSWSLTKSWEMYKDRFCTATVSMLPCHGCRLDSEDLMWYAGSLNGEVETYTENGNSYETATGVNPQEANSTSGGQKSSPERLWG